MKHSHYFKPIPPGTTHVDVYRVLAMFEVADPCLQHAIKKLLVAGGRGAGKDPGTDVQEAIDSLERWKAMRAEDVVSLAKGVTTGGLPVACGCGNGACRGPSEGHYCVRFMGQVKIA